MKSLKLQYIYNYFEHSYFSDKVLISPKQITSPEIFPTQGWSKWKNLKAQMEKIHSMTAIMMTKMTKTNGSQMINHFDKFQLYTMLFHNYDQNQKPSCKYKKSLFSSSYFYAQIKYADSKSCLLENQISSLLPNVLMFVAIYFSFNQLL